MKAYFKNADDLPSVTNFLKNSKPSYSPKPQTWFNKNGTIDIIEDLNGNIVYKYSINVNGVPTSVNYVNGYPDFSDYMHKSKGAS